MRLIPGGFAAALLGPNAAQSPEVVAAIEDKYGLNDPVIVQYGLWLGNAVRGDLGESLRTHSSVTSEIVRRSLLITVGLTFLATLMSLVVGVPAGLVAALRRNSVADILTRLVSLVGLSIPDFVLGTLLIYLCIDPAPWPARLRLHPAERGFLGHLRSMVLPTLSLGVITTAVVMQVIRFSVVEVLGRAIRRHRPRQRAPPAGRCAPPRGARRPDSDGDHRWHQHGTCWVER